MDLLHRSHLVWTPGLLCRTPQGCDNDKIITEETKKSKNKDQSPLLNKNTYIENKEKNNTKEVETKAIIKKNKKSESSSSSSDSDNNNNNNNNNKNLCFSNDDKYKPSRINKKLRNVSII